MAQGARLVVIACACTVLLVGAGLGAARSTRTPVELVARRQPGGVPLAVLTGRGVDGALFGQSAAQVTARLDSLLGPPSRRYGAYLGVCEVDHELGWRDLRLFFFKGRFAGYSYGPPPALRAPLLATDRGFAIGDTMAAGRRLYHRRFRLTTAQGGAWFATDSSGIVDGLAAGGPPVSNSDIGPLSRAASIGAGHQGCPAMTP